MPVRPGIAVVIPTRDRPASLRRLLDALARQDRLPDQVIVVDAGRPPADPDTIRAPDRPFPITHIGAAPGVCAQRNVGIRLARHPYVLLCDDDIEPPREYLARLVVHLEHENLVAVTGLLSEPGPDGAFRSGFEVPSLRHIVFAFLFQVTVWGDVEAMRTAGISRPLLAALKRWYRRRGNTFTLAGWPLLTQVRGPVVRTALYGLGAALVRREWLLRSPFDERLGPHGIGDNYGVALGFPGDRSIAVIADLPVRHHRAPENRLAAAETYFRRVLALDLFLRSDRRFSRFSRAALAWSLVGNAVRFGARGRWQLAARSLHALARVTTGRNPLLRGTADPAGRRGGHAGAEPGAG